MSLVLFTLQGFCRSLTLLGWLMVQAEVVAMLGLNWRESSMWPIGNLWSSWGPLYLIIQWILCYHVVMYKPYMMLRMTAGLPIMST